MASDTEEFLIRSRHQSSYEKFQNFNSSDNSQDELDADEYDYRRTSIHRQEKTSIVNRFFTSIVTFIITCWYKTSRIFNSETNYRNARYTRLDENQGTCEKLNFIERNDWSFVRYLGFFSRVTSAITSTFVSIFRYIYLIIASIQFWDSCLLQSSSAGRSGKKRFLLLLLLLFPLLLLAGK